MNKVAVTTIVAEKEARAKAEVEATAAVVAVKAGRETQRLKATRCYSHKSSKGSAEEGCRYARKLKEEYCLDIAIV